MKIIKSSVEIVNPPAYDSILNLVEQAGRICYKSEDKITKDSAEKFVKNILKSGHEAVIEHAVLSIKFICDRGVSHEIVRHRMASYCQESTRYCNYSKDKFQNEITVIKPCSIVEDSPAFNFWKKSCKNSEIAYFNMLSVKETPQNARSVLPNSLKTELVMTANIREWRHFLRLRTANAAHPDMRYLARMLLEQMKEKYPVFFEDITYA